MAKIELAWGNGVVEVGKKVSIYGKEYTLVGINGDATVFACLEPKTLEDAMVIELTDDEIDEFIKNGDLIG